MAKIKSKLKKLIATNNVKETSKIVHKHVSGSKPRITTSSITKKESTTIIISNTFENKQPSFKINPKIGLKLNLKPFKINSSIKTTITKDNHITERL